MVFSFMHEGWKLRLKSREDNAHDFVISKHVLLKIQRAGRMFSVLV